MDYDKEIAALAAETLAVQAVLSNVLGHLCDSDPRLAEAVRAGFDDAEASFFEDMANKLGKARSPDQAVKAFEIVERLRASTLREPDKPKRGV